MRQYKGRRFNVSALAQEVARREGKKVQVSIGNIREVIAKLSDIIYDGKVLGDKVNPTDVVAVLILNGHNRSKRKKK